MSGTEGENMAKKGKEAKRKDKKQRTGKKHLSLKPHEFFDVSGGPVKRKNKHCPRCGPGTWLGAHKGRLYCGKCGYTEFEKRTSEKPSHPQEAKSDGQTPGEAGTPESPGEEKKSPESG
jgi:small subunit ribosomal protein S27Ae